MTEYIKRETAAKWVKDESAYCPDGYYCVCHDWHCSNCGETVNDRHELPKYCPECGFPMG